MLDNQHDGSRLSLSSNLRAKLLGGGAYALVGRGLTALAVIGVNGFVTRLLNQDAAGRFFVVVSVATFAALLGGLGLPATSVRIIAESLGRGQAGVARQAIRTVLVGSVMGSIAVSALLFVCSGILDEFIFKSTLQLSVLLALIGLTVARTFQALLEEVLRSFHDIKNAVLFGGLVANGVALAVLAVLHGIVATTDIAMVLTALLAATVLSNVWASIQVRNHVRRLPPRAVLASRQVVAIALPLLVTSAILFLSTQAGIWIVGARLPSEDAALYGAAMRLVQLIAMPLVIVNAVVPPIIAELYFTGRVRELELAIRRAALVSGLPAIAVLVMYLIVGSWLMGLIFGDDYSSGALILQISSAGALSNVLAGSCGLVLMMTGNQRALMHATFVCAGLTLLAGWFSVAQFGAVGVAIAFAGGLALQNAVMVVLVKQKTGIWTFIGW